MRKINWKGFGTDALVAALIALAPVIIKLEGGVYDEQNDEDE